MAVLRKIPVVWSGIGALPGLSVFYAPFGTDAGANLNTFFIAIKALFPPGMTWTVPTSGDTITDSTGLITGAWTGGSGGITTANGSGVYAAGTGAYVNWQTASIVGTRRLKGRTFLCPLTSGSYAASGTIVSTSQTTLQNAATTLAASGNLLIWHRPTTPGGSNGSSGTVVGALVPTQVTSLRSRRS